MKYGIKIIAYYLPQFHPFKENDEWWGKGFTEWTNVGKARPLFKGHKQPKVPADLGYYDLRLQVVREQQVELAREAGVDAFCYWHYYFGGKGRQLMNEIIDDVLETGKPDFPFCFGWANEPWKAKLWNKDGIGDNVLMEQRYEGIQDYRNHYEYVSNFFKDSRYVRIEDKPFFLIYKPQLFEEVATFIKLWNNWIREDGIAEGIYFVANMDSESDFEKLLSQGFSAVTPGMQSRTDITREYSKLRKALANVRRQYWPSPVKVKYDEVSKHIWKEGIDNRDEVIPFIIPNWDHTPRSGHKGRVFINSTPMGFYQQALDVLKRVGKKKNKIVMLKSWNEWAEGNYMEPDLDNGKQYIKSLQNAKVDCLK